MKEENEHFEDSGKAEDLLALKKFFLDIDCLDSLDEWVNRFNLFEVLGISRMEIRHSNVLGWLLDPNQNHGLGDAVIRGFINHVAAEGGEDADVLEALLLDCRDFTVRREWRNIDILAVSDVERCVVCIENKIGTGEHSDQLNRYRGVIESQFPGFRHIFIYLTPDGGDSSNPDNWCALGYGKVLKIIESAKSKVRLLPDAELLIDNYVETIRRNVLEDDRIERLCAAIYSKHRRALDLIYEHRPDRASALTASIYAWAELRDAEGKIVLDRDNCNKTYTRFTTTAMSEILPNSDEAISGWGTCNHYFYEVVNDKGEKFESWLALSAKGADSDLLMRFGSIFQYSGSKPTRSKWAWHHVPFGSHNCIVDDGMSEDDIFKQLDAHLDALKRFEDKIIPLVRDEFAQGSPETED